MRAAAAGESPEPRPVAVAAPADAALERPPLVRDLGAVASTPTGVTRGCQTIASRMTGRPQRGHELAYRASMARLIVEPEKGALAIPTAAESIWRRSGGHKTTSARSRVSGQASKLAARRCSAMAARATHPPRPFRTRTTSPGFVQASISAA